MTEKRHEVVELLRRFLAGGQLTLQKPNLVARPYDQADGLTTSFEITAQDGSCYVVAVRENNRG